jgi:hypothetical protein
VRCIQAALSSAAQTHVRVLDPGEGHWGFRTERIDSEEDFAASRARIGRIEVEDITLPYPSTLEAQVYALSRISSSCPRMSSAFSARNRSI